MRTPLEFLRETGMLPSGWGATTVPVAFVADALRRTADWIVRGDDDLEYIRGTRGDDLVRGNGGDDYIKGRGGDDRLFGGDGNDWVRGDGGDDYLHGNSGADVLKGGSGDDLVLGGYGDDWLFGGFGGDRLHGGNGVDRLWGGPGADALWGEGGDDYIIGGSGNDVLVGGSGADRMAGGRGNDTYAWLKGDVFQIAHITRTITSTEADAPVDGEAAPYVWIPWDVGRGGAVGIGDDPADEGRSVRLEGVDGGGGQDANGDYSAGIGLFWDPFVGPSAALGDELTTLGSLRHIAYDWYRDAISLNGSAEAPALRLHVDADADLATDDAVVLIYEPYWNGNGVVAATNAWQTVSLEGTTLQDANFWAISARGVDPARDRTFAERLNGEAGDGFTPLSKDSLVTGIDLSAGDGWVGDFAGAVDNVALRFDRATTVFDFETPQPDLIADFRSGHDKLDFTDLYAPDTDIASMLTVEALNNRTTLISAAPIQGAEAEPIVVLRGDGFDLAQDLVIANEFV